MLKDLDFSGLTKAPGIDYAGAIGQSVFSLRESFQCYREKFGFPLGERVIGDLFTLVLFSLNNSECSNEFYIRVNLGISKSKDKSEIIIKAYKKLLSLQEEYSVTGRFSSESRCSILGAFRVLELIYSSPEYKICKEDFLYVSGLLERYKNKNKHIARYSAKKHVEDQMVKLRQMIEDHRNSGLDV